MDVVHRAGFLGGVRSRLKPGPVERLARHGRRYGTEGAVGNSELSSLLTGVEATDESVVSLGESITLGDDGAVGDEEVSPRLDVFF